MRQGQIYVNMTGHRKATSYRCARCSAARGEAVWHDTPRGLTPEVCPLDASGVDRPVPHAGVRPQSPAPAHIPREKLGTMPKVRNWQVVNMLGPSVEE